MTLSPFGILASDKKNLKFVENKAKFLPISHFKHKKQKQQKKRNQIRSQRKGFQSLQRLVNQQRKLLPRNESKGKPQKLDSRSQSKRSIHNLNRLNRLNPSLNSLLMRLNMQKHWQSTRLLKRLRTGIRQKRNAKLMRNVREL